jgi:hypothetical protein
MAISLEDIDLVRDRTGSTNKEAKEALEASGGSVIDAIIYIEDRMDGKESKRSVKGGATKVVETVKETIKKGNVSRIVVRNESDEILLNVPVNVSAIGVVIAPILTLGYLIAIYGKKCKVELIKTNGDVVDVTKKGEAKVRKAASKVKAAATKSADKVKETAPNAVSKVKEAAEKGASKVKESAPKAADKAKEFAGEALLKGKDFAEKTADKAQKAKDKLDK